MIAAVASCLVAAVPAFAQVPVREAPIAAGLLSGRIVDNVLNAEGQGSGFKPLEHAAYPGKAIFRPDMVGLNFEHIFNGAAADKAIAMFTPRRDRADLVPLGPASVELRWPAAESSWAMDCTMRYTLAAPNAVDIVFEATPREARYPMGFAAFMWASYMNRTRERAIHFIGRDGDREGWMSFGEDTADGFETGTVAHIGAELLPYEDGAELLNLVEHPTKRFVKPFYYGLLDGDNDLSTNGDTLAYIVMFDRAEPIRFALWNFIRNADGEPDPHSPAWDWQFVVRDPQPKATYGYRMRVVIEPFTTREAVEQTYETWRASLAAAP